ncbi:cardiolipin synthase [Bacteroides sp. 519]|uniref:cardiolipin synthase n=1 Tax=Bacteroides sp. 519 TaxID=2302937 RepID=UPI0013D55B96|nr:cardiolipin synthase [Bacteroides sp. 519]NDV57132.1 cardiolipin synthase [Bacteroides sp. 519]
MDPNEILKTVYSILFSGVIISTIIVIILDNRNPVKTIAWILILLFLPWVGLVFYLFFGRSTRRERIIGRKIYNKLIKKPIEAFEEQKPGDVPPEYERLMKFFWDTTQALPFDGNQVDAYTDGYTKLAALIKELYKAKQHIHLQYYIFLDDAVGRLIRDVLIDKAKEGVEVRVLYDDVGSWKTRNDFFEEMRDAGIEVRSFLKVRFPLFTSRVNYRNHRKIVVIDGKVGFVGGMNLAERYVKGFTWGVWRDTHIRIKGKAVHGLQTSFLLDWYFVDRTLLTSACYYPRLESYGDSLIQVVTSDPIGPWKEIMQGLTMAITGAQKYIYIQTPYFLPTETILAAMQTAALAGVDVRLMIPKRADSSITQWGSRSYLSDILMAGVKVYFYQKGFLHSKMMVSDDKLSTVGSTNIDFRSFEHNFEVNAFIYDMESALMLKDVFLQDQRECIRISPKAWSKRPLHQKAIESAVRLIAPLL